MFREGAWQMLQDAVEHDRTVDPSLTPVEMLDAGPVAVVHRMVWFQVLVINMALDTPLITFGWVAARPYPDDMGLLVATAMSFQQVLDGEI